MLNWFKKIKKNPLRLRNQIKSKLVFPKLLMDIIKKVMT